MKIAVFGATGSIGQCVTRQALGLGYDVTALVRQPDRVAEANVKLKCIQGDVLKDFAAVRQVVAGSDAVVVALGAGARGRVRAEGTRNIIEAMKLEGVKHLICQSTMGAGDSARLLNARWRWLFWGPLRWAMADHEQQETFVRESGLDWTIVRPASFTDGPLTEAYRHGDLLGEALTLKVSRADVAHFLVNEARQPRYIGDSVSLSN